MPEARPADPLSILSLAAGLAAMVLTLFSIMPMLGWCFLPMSALAALTALSSGVISVIKTTRRPELDGRQQALMGLALSGLWVLSAGVLFTFMSRR